MCSREEPTPAVPAVEWQVMWRLLAAEGMMTRDKKEADGWRMKFSALFFSSMKGHSHLFPNQSHSQITV